LATSIPDFNGTSVPKVNSAQHIDQIPYPFSGAQAAVLGAGLVVASMGELNRDSSAAPAPSVAKAPRSSLLSAQISGAQS
jgi:hypothetical protein